jgi:hypothetical protein
MVRDEAGRNAGLMAVVVLGSVVPGIYRVQATSPTTHSRQLHVFIEDELQTLSTSVSRTGVMFSMIAVSGIPQLALSVAQPSTSQACDNSEPACDEATRQIAMNVGSREASLQEEARCSLVKSWLQVR